MMKDSDIDLLAVCFVDRANHLAINVAIARHVFNYHLRTEYDNGMKIGEAWYNADGERQLSLCTNTDFRYGDVFNPLYNLDQMNEVSVQLESMETRSKSQFYYQSIGILTRIYNSARFRLSPYNPIVAHLFALLVSIDQLSRSKSVTEKIADEIKLWQSNVS